MQQKDIFENTFVYINILRMFIVLTIDGVHLLKISAHQDRPKYFLVALQGALSLFHCKGNLKVCVVAYFCPFYT